MRFVKLFCLFITFLLLLVACDGGQTTDSRSPEIEGPALVMFYTDN